MSTRNERLEAICRIIQTETIGNQEELLNKLNESGYPITQATLSRDVRQLRVSKVHDAGGNYIYHLPDYATSIQTQKAQPPYPTIEFSGSLAVIKTRPGYAMGIASDIDTKAPHEILATIAGDDTILIIPREGISRDRISRALAHFL